jgi:apolipoprotein D and lipocalin family protein
MRTLSIAGRLLGLASMLALAHCNLEPPLNVASNVDLTSFQGKWYEIASLPRTTQTDCYGTTAFYTQAADGSLQFVNQCNVESPNGPLKTVTMTATVPDPSVPAKLALDVGGFSGAYWITEVGPSYEYAVVGHPSRAYLWILSRTPTLDPTTTGGIIDRAQANHFDMSKLQFTPQPPGTERADSANPVGPVPAAPPSGSCATSPGTGGAGWVLAFACGAIAWRRSARGKPHSKRNASIGSSCDALRAG